MRRSVLFACGVCLSAAAAVAGALPQVSNVSMTQEANRTVTIRYHLDKAPAIVTLDLELNGSNVTAEVFGNAVGEYNRKVTTAGDHTIVWKVRKSPLSGADYASARALVKAWPLKRPPDYMVVDLDHENDIRYYTSSNALPGGLLGNDAYRQSKLVMRLIRAKGIDWTMGCCGEAVRYGTSYFDREAEQPHAVKLDHDYWIGVFEITQAQWSKFKTNVSSFKAVEGAMRPAESMNYHDVRHANSQGDNTLAYYPAAPGDKSYLGLLRERTGLSFDLPSEAEWEFACRAGTGEATFNDGTPAAGMYGTVGIFPGRCQTVTKPNNNNQISANVGPTNGTAVVGSYPPSKWGTYDMHGNVAEMCLDWYRKDISTLGGAVNANGANYADGTTPANAYRSCRGGGWWHYACYSRSASRTSSYCAYAPEKDFTWKRAIGFRVICPLEEE